MYPKTSSTPPQPPPPSHKIGHLSAAVDSGNKVRELVKCGSIMDLVAVSWWSYKPRYRHSPPFCSGTQLPCWDEDDGCANVSAETRHHIVRETLSRPRKFEYLGHTVQGDTHSDCTLIITLYLRFYTSIHLPFTLAQIWGKVWLWQVYWCGTCNHRHAHYCTVRLLYSF